MRLSSVLLTLLVLGSPGFGECANILFFHVVASPSHRSAIFPLAGRLADAGHNVTYIFPLHRRPGSHPKVEEFVASKMVKAVDAFYETCEINLRLNNTINDFMFDNFIRGPEFCGLFYDSPETQELLAHRQFDLILMDASMGQCAYGLVHHFKAKHIIFNPVMVPYAVDCFGLVPESSSVPDILFHPTPAELQTSLWSRTINAVVAPVIWRAAFLYSMWNMEAVVRDKMKSYESGESMPSFPEIEQETSLVLQNSYFVEDYPMSLPPMFVSYSGLWCSEKERSNRKPLPVNMESFLNDPDSSGFVYISFGSIVHVHSMPAELRNQFMAVFRAFPNLRFLWKWNGPVPKDTPKNVLLSPWFPQPDVLAHPKIKAFVTQVGRSSTQEALCYGVPIIGIPMIADQDQNAQRLVELGAAVQLDVDTLSHETMIPAIRQITETESYRNAALQLSVIFRDRPMDPLENVFYWVEYALKYNTTLLKPLAMKQRWWQRRLLDVYALIATIIFLILFLSLFVGYWIIKVTVRICSSSKRIPRDVSNKKKD